MLKNVLILTAVCAGGEIHTFNLLCCEYYHIFGYSAMRVQFGRYEKKYRWLFKYFKLFTEIASRTFTFLV